MRLFHCADPIHRDRIKSEGLRGIRFEGEVFAWPTLDAAHAYRFDMNASGWADIWALEDHGHSKGSASMSAGETARVLEGDVPPQDLELVYRAR